MKHMSNKGLSGLYISIMLIVLIGLFIWGFSVVDKFIEHTRATEAENTINLAASAQGRHLMSKGVYMTKWTGLDLGPLSPRAKKVGDYVSRDGTVYFTRGGGENNTRSGFQISFAREYDGFFIVAQRINSRYQYELVRKLPDETVYCIPRQDNKRDLKFCLDFMNVSDASQLPADPRVRVLSNSFGLWN